MNASGEIALDTTITDYTGMIKYYDSAEEMTVLAVPTANLSTTDGYVVAYNATNNELEMVESTGGGKVLQQVSTSYATYASATTVMPSDDTIPQNTEGTEIMTLAITPQSATSTLLIEYVVPLAGSAVVNVQAGLFVDSTASAIKASYYTTGGLNYKALMIGDHRVASASTSARTYKLRVGPAAGTIYFNGISTGRLLGGMLQATMIITEIEA